MVELLAFLGGKRSGRQHDGLQDAGDQAEGRFPPLSSSGELVAVETAEFVLSLFRSGEESVIHV